MLALVGILTSISATLSAPVDNKDSTYILATVLYYKDALGQIMIASGPVPEITHYTIRDDIMSRIKGAAVKVVPIFQDSSAMPRSLDILEFIKEQYNTVLVTEIPKRLSRNFVKDLWHYYWHGVLGKSSKKHLTDGNKRTITDAPMQNTTSTRLINRVKQPVGYKETGMIVYPIFYTKDKPTTTPVDVEINEAPEAQETTVCPTCVSNAAAAKKNAKSPTEQTDNTKLLTSADDFIPNDIYYNIEKKCVNWSDGCNVGSKSFLNLTSRYFKYVYTRPRIVKWGL